MQPVINQRSDKVERLFITRGVGKAIYIFKCFSIISFKPDVELTFELWKMFCSCEAFVKIAAAK